MPRIKSLLVIFLFPMGIFAQEPQILENIRVPDFVDTLFIDHDINNWSLRVFANYKDHSFQLNNSDHQLIYTPNNPGGIGIGVATQKIILDCGFNLQLRDEERTERFDFRIALMLKKHHFSYFLQSYHGFTLKNELQTDNQFRSDLSSLSSGLNYMYIFNAGKYSISAMKSGLSKQKRTALSFGLGGFAFYNRMLADSSIVPSELEYLYNDEAMLTRLYGIGGGVQGGFSITIPFLKNLFTSASLTPGIGYSYKDVYTETGSYSPTNSILAHSRLEGILGYNGKRYYINFSISLGFYKTSIDFGNWIGYRTSQAKLAVGYKLGRN